MKTILLVEDEALIAMNEARMLTNHGYKVLTAYNAKKAIEAVNQNNIDLILMDIDLGPGKMDGTEAAEIILQKQEKPVVFLTSHSEEAMVDKVKGITRYGYVLKNSGQFVLKESISMAFELFEAYRKTRESEEKYRAAFMTSPDAVNINRMDGLYVDINEGFTNLTGFNRDDVIGKLSSEIRIWAIPEDREKLIKGLKENGKVENLESVFRCKDGSHKTALMSARIINLNNEPHILSITRDITLRKKAEEEAAKAKKFLENISDIAYEADTNGNVIYVNSAVEKITGFSVEQIIGRPFLPLFIKEDQDSLMNVYRKTLEGKSLENTLTFLNGTTCHFTTLPRYDKNGNIIGTFGIARDITEYRQIELKLKVNLERYRKAQELAAVGNWEYHIEANAFWGSEEGKRIYGFDPVNEEFPEEKVMGCVIEKERVKKALNDLIEKDTPYDIEFDIIPYNSNERKTIHSVAELERDEHGNPVKVLGIMHDITSRKQAERQKDFLIKELNHRIKNNLAMISSLINLKDSTLGEKVDLSDIRHQIDAIRIVHEKLYETGEITHVGMEEYIGDLLTTVFSSFTPQQIKLNLNIDEISLETKNAVTLGLMINEIATNAIKHGFTEEEATFSLELRECKTERHYMLTISNTGKPFPEGVDLETPSTLGVQLISALVKQLGGTVELRREPQTTFIIRFPKKIDNTD